MHDLLTREGAEKTPILYGIYDDVYKKVFGKWLIYRTRIDFLGQSGALGNHETLRRETTMTEFAFIDELSGDSFEEDTSAKKTFPLMPEGEAFDMGTR